MAEYIDLEELGTAMQHIYNDPTCPMHIAAEIEQIIDCAPAADVAPVVHGRWEFLGPNRLIKECMCGTCSVCKVRSKYIVNTMLCPNCGAKMDGWDNIVI